MRLLNSNYLSLLSDQKKEYVMPRGNTFLPFNPWLEEEKVNNGTVTLLDNLHSHSYYKSFLDQ